MGVEEANLPSIIELENTFKRESRILDFMQTVVEQKGEQLFPIRKQKLSNLTGVGRSEEVTLLGVQREMIYNHYMNVQIPKIEARLEESGTVLRQQARVKAKELDRLLESGFIDPEMYEMGMEPLKEYLVGFDAEVGDEYLVKRRIIEERINGVKFRGTPLKVVRELLKSLTAETAYPTKVLREAVFDDEGEKHRDGASMHLSYIRNRLSKAGVTIVTILAGENTKYYLGLIDDEIIGVSGAVPNKSPVVKGEGNFIDRIDPLQMSKVQERVVGYLKQSVSFETGIAKESLISLVYPGVDPGKAQGRFNMVLPRVKDKLEEAGIYVHMNRHPGGSKYFLSEVPSKRRSDRKIKPKSDRPRRGVRVDAVLSDKEVTRRGIEERVKQATFGQINQDLLDEGL